MVVDVNTTPKTLRDYLSRGISLLKTADISSYELDARLLLRHAYALSEEELISKINDQVDDAGYMDLVIRRSNHEPVAKIIGYKEFFGLKFKTTKDTLDPRADSETLIEAVLQEFPDKQSKVSILDLGTGTGCLLLTLLDQYPNATGYGVDISVQALEIARENADSLKLASRCDFIESDFANFESVAKEGFDIIISNPPYIAIDDDRVNQDAFKHDPRLALFAGEDGLAAYRVISPSIKKHIKPTGKFFLEIGMGQEHDVSRIFKRENLVISESYRDIQGITRCLSGFSKS